MSEMAAARTAVKKIFERADRASLGIVAAVSGGPDSMVLWDLLCKEHANFPQVSLAAVHVNYGLRGAESDDDEEFVAGVVKASGCPFHLYKVSEAERNRRRGESVQEWARRLRFAWFKSFAAENLIAMGHHQGDVAENVLLRLSRGSSVGQLFGMTGLFSHCQRPLLCLSKETILEYARRQVLPYRVDSSNDKLIYERNRIRHVVLRELAALHPGVEARIAETAREAKDLVAYVHESFAKELSPRGPLPGSWLRHQPPGVAVEAIAWCARNVMGKQVLLSRTILYKTLAKIAEAPKKPVKWVVQIGGGGYIRVEGDHVCCESGFQLPFAGRSRQHRRNVTNCKTKFLLAPGAVAEILHQKSGEIARFESDSAGALEVGLLTKPVIVHEKEI